MNEPYTDEELAALKNIAENKFAGLFVGDSAVGYVEDMVRDSMPKLIKHIQYLRYRLRELELRDK